MKGVIYLIQNIVNGKCYVGKTYGTIQQRFKRHIHDSKRKNSSKKNIPLYKAFNKYGVHSFTVVSLGEWEETQLELMEQYYIKFFNTYKSGYNATLGGGGGCKYSFSKDEIEYAIKTTNSILDASKVLGVSTDTIKLFADKYNLSLKIGSTGYIRYRFTQEEIQDAIDKSKSTKEAAKLLGVDYATFIKFATRYDLPLKIYKSEHLISNISYDEIKTAIDSTNNIAEASRVLKVSTATVRYHAKRHNLTLKIDKTKSRKRIKGKVNHIQEL